MTDQWELCCVGLSVKFDSPQGGHQKYALDEYIERFINPTFKLKGDQAYQDIIYPSLLLQSTVYFRRKIRPKLFGSPGIAVVNSQI